MQFNSIEFAVFFGVVLMSYYSIPQRFRPILLLAASYLFYMAWRVEYIGLILFSTLLDYYVGAELGRSALVARRKMLLALSIVGNCGVLVAFKYWNFLTDSANAVARAAGGAGDFAGVEFLLPVGISFYTFQTLSYTIDVYRGEKSAETSLLKFALYVSFFPQLVAGPIERSTRLLPQLHCRTDFQRSSVVSGLQLMLWGLFKKVVIADTLAVYVDAVYGAPSQFSGLPLIIATYAFAFQIYCDFSGYSDIAIGAARTIGVDLMQNFRQPYFARSVADFWGRWHISLSTWFRDYVYIPLGGSRVSASRWCVNIAIVFVVSGLWHGAAWTFVVWGAIHATYLLLSVGTKDLREWTVRLVGLDKYPRLRSVLQVVATFHLVLVGWVFFRASTFSDAFQVFRGIASTTVAELLRFPVGTNVAPSIGSSEMVVAFCAVLVLLMFHLGHEAGKSPLELVSGRPTYQRWSVYAAFALAVLNLGVPNEIPFIYFQF